MKLLTDEQLDVACKEHAEEQGGNTISLCLKEDLLEVLSYTDSMWESGVPVTKYYTRNDPRRLFIPKGTKLKGIEFLGQVSGSTVIEFYYGHSWYQMSYADDFLEKNLED